MSNDFSFEKKQYPSGDEFYELRVGGVVIGGADPVDGGYLAFGRKKPVSSLKEAGKQCLDAKMNACMKEHAKLQRLLQRLLASE